MLLRAPLRGAGGGTLIKRMKRVFTDCKHDLDPIRKQFEGERQGVPCLYKALLEEKGLDETWILRRKRIRTSVHPFYPFHPCSNIAPRSGAKATQT